MAGIREMIDSVVNSQPVKVFFEALNTAVTPQKELKTNFLKSLVETARKEGVELSGPQKDKTNAPNRTKALAEEGLGHITRAAKVELAIERLKDLRGEKDVKSALDKIEKRLDLAEKDGTVLAYRREYRRASFQERTADLLSGSDGRRLDELTLTHEQQKKDLAKPFASDPSLTVGDHLADILVFEALATKKSMPLNKALAEVEKELKSERKRIAQRSLIVASRISNLDT